MEKPALLKKLDAMLDEAESVGYWGTIEIEIRKGAPVLLRKSVTEQLRTEETPSANRFQR